ncbi:hypothetical protein D8I24_0527 (plasmid) [Cupriavidus necator H850]|nr:hypothetical protein D8I24_0527 [Cupriavidus necator H850]
MSMRSSLPHRAVALEAVGRPIVCSYRGDMSPVDPSQRVVQFVSYE